MSAKSIYVLGHKKFTITRDENMSRRELTPAPRIMHLMSSGAISAKDGQFLLRKMEGVNKLREVANAVEMEIWKHLERIGQTSEPEGSKTGERQAAREPNSAFSFESWKSSREAIQLSTARIPLGLRE